MRRIFGLILTLCVLVVAVHAQSLWEKKEPKKWSESECKKVLEDSPWAKQYSVATPVLQQVSRGNRSENGFQNDAVQALTYTVQIRSAVPVREAMIQRAKMRSNYDKMPAEKKAAVDKTAEDFLSQKFPDTVVIGVTYSSNYEPYDREMATYWQQQTVETLKTSVYLIAAGKRISPSALFVAPDAPRAVRELELVFPRQIDGKPILGPDDKSLGFELQAPTIENGVVITPAGSSGVRQGQATASQKNGERVFVEFNVKKMTNAKGEVVF